MKNRRTTSKRTSGGLRYLGGAALILLAACGASACSSAAPPAEAAGVSTGVAAAPAALEEATAQVFEETEVHADRPPHGGIVVPLGAHVAHAEIVVVPDSGEVTLHVLDADGQPGLRIAQPTVLVDVETSGRLVRLEMQASPLEDAGERVGNASRFSARSDDLLRVGEGSLMLKWVGVNGQVYSDVVVDLTPAGS